MALDEVPPVHGDPARIGQLLDNLISNSIKFTPAGGSVRVALQRGGPAVLVSVADTGPGIPAEDQPRLFDRFFRSEGSGAGMVQGSGLGLAIAKAIVHAHAGRLWVESDVGRGSTFRFELAGVPSPAAEA
jgi:histidine kinase